MKKSAQRLRTEKLINYFAGLKNVTRERQYDMLAGILLMTHPYDRCSPDRTVVSKCFDGKLIAERMDALNDEGMLALGYTFNLETQRWEKPEVNELVPAWERPGMSIPVAPPTRVDL